MKHHLHRLLTLSKTFHFGALRSVGSPVKFIQHLRDVNSVDFSHALPPLKAVTLPDVVGEDFRAGVDIPFGRVKRGSCPLADLACLAALAKKKAPRRVFEIGTFEGLTSVVFAKNSGPATKIFSLDLPPEKDIPRTRRSFEAQSIKGSYQSGYLIDLLGCGPQVERLYGDSALFDFREYENSIDLFFIDGAHTAEYVARDSRSAFRAVNAAGWILWHDCFVPDIFKILKRIAAHHPVYQVAGTTLALSLEKPGSSFPLEVLEFRIR
ncbi:MAG: class I SAM-dependent methyltransferase [Candidatus Aminicenantes bacterium]|nr:class I SAM-dependent methyltransferase [Candidatus Aminicenantes bacterium]